MQVIDLVLVPGFQEVFPDLVRVNAFRCSFRKERSGVPQQDPRGMEHEVHRDELSDRVRGGNALRRG